MSKISFSFKDGADLVDLTQNIIFRYVKNHVHTKLQKYLNHMKKDDHLYIPTTTNYRVEPADYEQLLEKSMYNDYKKTDRAAIKNIPKADYTLLPRN